MLTLRSVSVLLVWACVGIIWSGAENRADGFPNTGSRDETWILRTLSPCDPDFNGDGNVDQDDIDALAQVVSGTECP